MFRRLPIVLFLLLAIPVSQAGQKNSVQTSIKQIDEYAVTSSQTWKVPGFAIAIVQDDRVLLAKGYGVRELSKPAAVDSNTLFAIGSNTKAFTAAALALLVDEGKIKWDDAVTKYLPFFQLYDPYVTRELTIRDLLSHRSGLPTFGGDLLWYQTVYGREEILRRIRYLKPASSFRSSFGYQNIMFLAAGEIIPAVTGKTWDQFLKENYFVPLGMARTTTNLQELIKNGNFALPHNEKDGKLRVIRYDDVTNVGGAGAVKSSVADMSQWIRLLLGRGTYNGKKFFSAAASREMWTPQTILGGTTEASEKFNPTRHFNLYGLGWILSDYQGRKVVSHGGGLDGMTSQVTLIPEEKLGIVVLTNSETSLSTILTYKAVDVILDVAPRDWSEEYRRLRKEQRATEELSAQKIEASRIENTRPSLPLSAYVGRYKDGMFGEATVSVENQKLVVRLVPAPNFVGDLEHWHLDTFRLKWRDSVVYPFAKGFVTFMFNRDGQLKQMKIDVPNPDFNFDELAFMRETDSSE